MEEYAIKLNIVVMLQVRGSSPFALPRKRANWAPASQGYSSCPRSMYARACRQARACFGISDFTMICGALKSASIAQGLLPPADLSPVTEALQLVPSSPFTLLESAATPLAGLMPYVYRLWYNTKIC